MAEQVDMDEKVVKDCGFKAHAMISCVDTFTERVLEKRNSVNLWNTAL